jgi:hypothetical protein
MVGIIYREKRITVNCSKLRRHRHEYLKSYTTLKES